MTITFEVRTNLALGFVPVSRETVLVLLALNGEGSSLQGADTVGYQDWLNSNLRVLGASSLSDRPLRWGELTAKEQATLLGFL